MREGGARAGTGKKRGARVDADKQIAVLKAARQLFSSAGFDSTPMSAVAACAGVSKATVYAHFGSKERLFRRALDDIVRESPACWESLLDLKGPLDKRLAAVALAILDTSVGPVMNCMHRALALSTPLSPQNRDRFWNLCFGRYDKVMREILSREAAKGTLDIQDVACASSQFFGLIAGEPMMHVLLLGDGKTISVDVGCAVSMFMRGHQPGAELRQVPKRMQRL